MPWPKGKRMSAEHVAKRSASLIASGARRKKPKIVGGREFWLCPSCGEWKLAGKFYMDSKTVAGLSSLCRRCHCAMSIRTRDPERARQANAAYMRRARLRDPEKFRRRERIASASRSVYPERLMARRLLNAAVRRGDIVRPPRCSECLQAKRLTAHHEDYALPLVVVWLCYGCHGLRHRVFEFQRTRP